MEELRALIPSSQGLASSSDDWQVQALNSGRIESSLYDCPVCGNRTVIYKRIESGEIVAVPCKCRKIRESIRLMKRSGLEQSIRGQTFESYHAAEPWQQNILDKARDMITAKDGTWSNPVPKEEIFNEKIKELEKDELWNQMQAPQCQRNPGAYDVAFRAGV